MYSSGVHTVLSKSSTTSAGSAAPRPGSHHRSSRAALLKLSLATREYAPRVEAHRALAASLPACDGATSFRAVVSSPGHADRVACAPGDVAAACLGSSACYPWAKPDAPTAGYNSFPTAPEVLKTSKGGFVSIRRRSTLDQLLQNEVQVDASQL
mgnify:CR=1 FL=1